MTIWKFLSFNFSCLPCSGYNFHRSWNLDTSLVEWSSKPFIFQEKTPKIKQLGKVEQGLAPDFQNCFQVLPIAIYNLPVTLPVTKNLPHLGFMLESNYQENYHHIYLLIFFYFLNLSTGQHIEHPLCIFSLGKSPTKYTYFFSWLQKGTYFLESMWPLTPVHKAWSGAQPDSSPCSHSLAKSSFRLQWAKLCSVVLLNHLL